MQKYRFKIIYKKFPHINEDLIKSFYLSEKSDRINPHTSLQQINDWLLKFKIDINLLTVEELLSYHEKRCLRLISGNLKHPSVIDLSLFEIYAPTKQIAYTEYQKYKQNKTVNMIEVLNDNPELRRGLSLEFQIQRHGKELGEIRYSENVKKQKNSSKRCKEYWISQGYSDEEAKLKVSEFQATFSLEKCVNKYGEEQGYIIWKERQNKWQTTLNSKTQEEIEIINKKKNIFNIESYMLRGFSKKESLKLLNQRIEKGFRGFSQECVNFIENNFTNLSDCLYGENEWVYYDLNQNKISFFDFTNLHKKIIFEYHGEKFHPNTQILTEEELQNWIHPYSKLKYKQVLQKDIYKKQLAISLGFKYFEIYSNDPQQIKNSIIDKINKILNS